LERGAGDFAAVIAVALDGCHGGAGEFVGDGFAEAGSGGRHDWMVLEVV